MLLNDNETEKFLFTQMAYKVSRERHALVRPLPIEAGILRVWVLADARFQRRGPLFFMRKGKGLFLFLSF